MSNTKGVYGIAPKAFAPCSGWVFCNLSESPLHTYSAGLASLAS